MKPTPISQVGEFGLIERIRKRVRARGGGVIVGIGDDAAVLSLNKKECLLATCDLLLEGVHFNLRECTFEEIGHKALGCGLSDIAAMGGLPRYALVSIGLPPSMSVEEVEAIYEGMERLARRFGTAIVGGDTDRSDKLIVDVTVVGVADRERLTLRSGARVGDAILVTGRLGGSRKGKHKRFTPRVREAQWLTRRFKVHAMIDISDGLASDLGHVARASGVGAVVFEEAIPRSKEARGVKAALSDGEDFELLFTARWADAQKIVRQAPRHLGIPVTMVGRIMPRGQGLRLVDRLGQSHALLPTGYRHF